jgi:hypothetical protein
MQQVGTQTARWSNWCAHTLLTAVQGTLAGSPAPSAAWLAGA